MADLLTVSLACNDDRGSFSGKLRAIEIDEGTPVTHGAALLSLIYAEHDDGIAFGLSQGIGALRIGDREWRISALRFRVGSLAYNEVEMTRDDAVSFATYLRANGFGAMEWLDEEPWKSIADPTGCPVTCAGCACTLARGHEGDHIDGYGSAWDDAGELIDDEEPTRG